MSNILLDYKKEVNNVNYSREEVIDLVNNKLCDNDYLFNNLVEDKKLNLLERVYSRNKCNWTEYWQGANKDYVLTVFYLNENGVTNTFYGIIDADDYESKFKGAYIRAHKNGANEYYARFKGGERIHRLIMNIDSNDVEVDHIYGHRLINIKEGLRPVSKEKNAVNRKAQCNKCKIHHTNNKYFFKDNKFNKYWLTDDIQKKLTKKGFSFTQCKNKGYCIVTSPYYDSKDEAYFEINKFEDLVYADYRYRPEYDLSESFYIAVMCFIMGYIKKTEISTYRIKELVFGDDYDLMKYYGLY